MNGNTIGRKSLQFFVEGKEFQWPEQYITGLQVKTIAKLPVEGELFLAIAEPWKDEAICNEDKVDLARPGLEQFFIRQKLKYTIDDEDFESNKQYIKGSELRKQGSIPIESLIWLSIEGPWEDELVKDDDWVDLARPGIEHFYSKVKEVKVTLIVNGREKEWAQGIISFTQVVTLAFNNYAENPNTVYTVTYAKGPKENTEGTMVKGDTIFVKSKMVFNVTATNKS